MMLDFTMCKKHKKIVIIFFIKPNILNMKDGPDEIKEILRLFQLNKLQHNKIRKYNFCNYK